MSITALDLPDGRVLELAVTGPADGPVLVLHHGTPGSLVRSRVVEDAAHRRGLRLVTFNRAGYGGSTRKPGRSVADAAADLESVLDHLGAERCLTLGTSGGGPHALACAALLPDRVAAAASVAGVGPYGVADLDFLAGMGADNVEEFGHAAAGEQQLRTALEPVAPLLREARAQDLADLMDTLLPEADRACLASGPNGEDLAAQFKESLRTGVSGWLDDDLAFVRPWGFALDAIAVPVFVWQGDRDLMVPVAHGRWLIDHVPGAAARLRPGEGHLSVFLNRADEILGELAAALG